MALALKHLFAFQLCRHIQRFDLKTIACSYGLCKLYNRYHEGTVRETEISGDDSPVIHVYHTTVPDTLLLPTSENFLSRTFVASLSQDKQDALDYYEMALTDGDGLLLQSHKEVSHKDRGIVY